MPSISRPLASEALRFAMAEEISGLATSEAVARTGRSARTLVKDGALRVTLVALGAGGTIAPHRSPGPITIHVLSGAIVVGAGDHRWPLATGDLLSVGAGVDHEVSSDGGGAFLLTVANLLPEAGG